MKWQNYIIIYKFNFIIISLYMQHSAYLEPIIEMIKIELQYQAIFLN